MPAGRSPVRKSAKPTCVAWLTSTREKNKSTYACLYSKLVNRHVDMSASVIAGVCAAGDLARVAEFQRQFARELRRHRPDLGERRAFPQRAAQQRADDAHSGFGRAVGTHDSPGRIGIDAESLPVGPHQP